MELGLGFGGGVAAFLTFALVYGLDLDELANAALPNIPVMLSARRKAGTTNRLNASRPMACQACFHRL